MDIPEHILADASRQLAALRARYVNFLMGQGLRMNPRLNPAMLRRAFEDALDGA